MNEEQGQDLIEIGVDLGMFVFVGLIIKGATFSPKELQELSDYCAKHIEEAIGMPAEDFALKIAPIIDKTIKAARER